MPLLLQRYARFIDSVIYLGVGMENRELKQQTKKSKHQQGQLEAYARSKATALQNGEGR